jgi:hypothetical protein
MREGKEPLGVLSFLTFVRKREGIARLKRFKVFLKRAPCLLVSYTAPGQSGKDMQQVQLVEVLDRRGVANNIRQGVLPSEVALWSSGMYLRHNLLTG